MVKKIFNKNFRSNFLIAEAGINHNGNINTAIKMIDKAKESGADAIKFQTYKTEKRVSKNSPIFKILKKCELSKDDFAKLKKYSNKKKIIFFSTPFDEESVDFLNSIKVKLFKVASFDISNYNLLNHIVKKRKPTILSTGMSTFSEINKAKLLFTRKRIPFSFLHCISSYPNSEKTSYLANIEDMRKKLNCSIGFSDHTNDIKTSIYSNLLGAKIIEKHFYLGKGHNCVDKPVSIDPSQMKKLKKELLNIENILGKVKYGVRREEVNALQFKRGRNGNN